VRIPLYDSDRRYLGDVSLSAITDPSVIVVWAGVHRDRPVRAYCTGDVPAELWSELAAGSGSALRPGLRTVYREWLPGAGCYVWTLMRALPDGSYRPWP